MKAFRSTRRWRISLFATLIGLALVAAPTANATPTTGGTTVDTTTKKAAPPFCADGGLVDLGSPLATITVHEGGYGLDPNGRMLGYAALSGENSALNIVDALTGERVDVLPLPGASGGWGITVDDQQRAYIGSYSNGALYSYDPQTGQVTDHGQPIANEGYVFGLSHAPDGTIYGGTYPNAHAFAFNPDTAEVTDFGSLTVDGSLYVRATAFDPDTGTLFAGLGSTGARLFAIDVATGERREVPLPDWVDAQVVTDLRYHDGKVFAYIGAQLVVLDAVTGQHLPLTNGATGEQVNSTPLISRGVSDPLDGVVYYSDFAPGTTRHRLVSLDLATLTFNAVPTQDGAPALPGAALGFGFTEGANGPVVHAFTGNYGGQAIQYDVTARQLNGLAYDVEPSAPNLGELTAGPDGQVYVNAFLNGNTARYDPASGGITNLPRFGQVEGWLWRDGLLYAGVYPYGAVQVWDPATPATAPVRLFELEASHDQNRPMALVADAERLYVGTTPGYGLHGGAVTVYDFATEEFVVYRNVVPDQSVSSLLRVSDVLLGGSSIDGGTGTTPIATEAKLFVLDPATGTVLADYTPVPGAHSINALTQTEDGVIWGLADGTAFTFDVDTGEVTTRIKVLDGPSGALDGELIEHPNGTLYGTTRNQIFAIDRTAGTGSVLFTDARRLTLHPNGDFYTLTRDPGGATADMNRLARFTPAKPHSACRS